MSFRNLSSFSDTRELKRIIVFSSENDIENSCIVDDYWIVREADAKDNIVYEKRFELDDYSEAVSHFEERSDFPVIWQDDEGTKEKFNWTIKFDW